MYAIAVGHNSINFSVQRKNGCTARHHAFRYEASALYTCLLTNNITNGGHTIQCWKSIDVMEHSHNDSLMKRPNKLKVALQATAMTMNH